MENQSDLRISFNHMQGSSGDAVLQHDISHLHTAKIYIALFPRKICIDKYDWHPRTDT